MADSDAKIAVAATEGEAVRGDLRSFVNERVLKRFKELLDEKRGDYKYAWEGDTTLKLEHRDNDECMACCMPGCFQNLVWKVSFGDGLNRSFNRLHACPWANKNAAMEISPVQAVFTQAKAEFKAQGKATAPQPNENALPSSLRAKTN